MQATEPKLVLFFDTEYINPPLDRNDFSKLIKPKKLVSLEVLKKINEYKRELCKKKPSTYVHVEPPPINKQPFITQLSFILFDPATYEIHDFYNAYVQLRSESRQYIHTPAIAVAPEGVPLSMMEELDYNECNRMHKCETEGKPIEEVLHRFYTAYNKAGRIIAHNIEADRIIMRTEMVRNENSLRLIDPGIPQMFKYNGVIKKFDVENYCTQQKTTKWAKLPMPPKKRTHTHVSSASSTSAGVGAGAAAPTRRTAPQYKWPALQELYRLLFHEEMPQPAHNAVVDTLAGLRCYLKFEEDLTIHPAKFRHMLERGFELASINPILMRKNMQILVYEADNTNGGNHSNKRHKGVVAKSMINYFGEATKA